MLHPSFHRLSCALLLVLPLSLEVPAEAFSIFGTSKKDSFSAAPPLPAPVALSVDRKQIIIIPLRVIGPQPEAVKFLLRSLPVHGTATLLPATSGTEAAVEYRPPEDRSITFEQFGFTAANSHGYSAEADIVIRITDRAGRIDLPARMDFPKAKVGFLSQQNLPLKNTGDAPISGTITVPPGWIVSPDSYVLKPQEEITLQISLLPTASGHIHGDLLFSHNPKLPIQLSATVEEWIQATPDPIKLLTVPGTKQRKAALRLHNDSAVPETVRLESEPPLIHSSEITLQPGDAQEITLASANLQSEPFGGTLRLSRVEGDQTTSHRLLLWGADAIGPILHVAAELDAPNIVPNDPSRFTPLALQNTGGREGIWSIQATPPFASDSTTLRILPGRFLNVHVSITAAPVKRTEGTLKIVGAGQTFEIPLVVTPAPASPTESQPPIGRRSFHLAHSAAAATGSTAIPEMDIPVMPSSRTARMQAPADPELARIVGNAYLPGLAVKGSQLRDITAHSAILNLPCAADIIPENILVESLALNVDPENNLLMYWNALPGIHVLKRATGHLELQFGHLKAATTYTVRVLGAPVGKGRRIALHQCDITTLPESSWFTLFNLSLTTGLGVAAFVFRVWYLRRTRGW